MTAPHAHTDTGHDETDRARLLAFAREMQDCGLHVMPPKEDGSKSPACDPTTGRRWKQFQTRPLTEGEFQAFFVKTKRTGLGCITGTKKTIVIEGHAVECYHEVLDFDARNVYVSWVEAANACGYGDITRRIEAGWLDYSPRGGHLHYWTPIGKENTKLAQYLNEEGHPKALIETRGIGGYIITACSFGTVHETGKPYVRVSGGPKSMTIVTSEEREALFRLARSFDRIPPKAERYEEAHGDHAGVGNRPGDIFAARTDWRDILEPHGWTFLFTSRERVSFWRRPGKERGVSATSGYAGTDYFYPFTTSSIFEANRAYNKFSAYTILNYGGDFVAAAAALAARGFTTNGHSGNGGASDEEENAHYTEQEREPDLEGDPEETANEGHTSQEKASTNSDSNSGHENACPYPCPDILRQGIFRDVSEILGLWSWEVWHGTFGALCARAHRNLHCFYYSDHIYGNNYSLLVNPTGTGKNIVVNIVRSALGNAYKVRVGLNSGPALVPMLTDDSLKAKEGRLEVRGVPVLLLCSEWSRIMAMAGIEHATLQEDLNDLFMRHYPWSQSRSHKSPNGGDVVITNPTLTVVATTTRALFHQSLTDKALGSGTINRYLIVPGSATFQPYTGTSYRADERLEGCLDGLVSHAFGFGREIARLYSPEAWQEFLTFQSEFLLPLHNDPSSSEALKRLHLHLQHISALYAWQTHAERIEIEHFRAAKCVIETSYKFLLELLEERSTSFEPTIFQAVESAMEKRVIAKVKKSPGLTRREIARRMSSDKGGYVAWGKTIDALLKVGALFIKANGKREELFAHPEC